MIFRMMMKTEMVIWGFEGRGPGAWGLGIGDKKARRDEKGR